MQGSSLSQFPVVENLGKDRFNPVDKMMVYFIMKLIYLCDGWCEWLSISDAMTYIYTHLWMDVVDPNNQHRNMGHHLL